MNQIAQLGILGVVALAVVAAFIFVAVTAVLDVPGIRPLPENAGTQVFAVLSTGTAAIVGAAVAVFGGKNGGSQ